MAKRTTIKIPHVKKVATPVWICNPAPVPDDVAPEGTQTRENTPWFVVLPALGVTVKALHEDDSPIVGYWDDRSAIDYCTELYGTLMADPKLLAEVRQNPEFPITFAEGGKIMQRTIMVPLPEA